MHQARRPTTLARAMVGPNYTGPRRSRSGSIQRLGSSGHVRRGVRCEGSEWPP
jgi:hypothetical protein